MTPEQLALVNDSAAVLLARSDQWSDRFYVHMFDGRDEVRAMFPADLAAQRVKFVDEIQALLALVADLDAFEDRAAHLGANHVGFGVRAAHYRVSSASLVAAVADVLGDDATPELLDAWRTVHDLVAEAMMGGAANVVDR